MSFIQQQLFDIDKKDVQKHRIRKNHNQYFTPEFVVEKALSLISVEKIGNIIDPAAGNGVFVKLASTKWKKSLVFGIDIDKEIITCLKKLKLPNSFFFCANSLLKRTWMLPEIEKVLSEGGFDLVVGNPPFSSWFHRIEAKEILTNFELAKNNGNLKRSQAIEILFLELFVSLAKVGGFIVIVLPDGILSNPQNEYVRGFILKNTKVLHIISLPRNVFEDTSAKTSILILKKQEKSNLNYFSQLHDLEKTGKVNNTIKVSAKDLIKRMDYCYHHIFNENPLRKLEDSGVEFRPLKDFVVYCKTGKTLYGEERKFSTKGIRFLHATNITDIGINYKKDERFIDPSGKMYFPSAYANVGDILFVRVGVGCAGRVAIVDTKDDEGIATDYIHIFRVKNINPYFLVVYLKTGFGKVLTNLLRHGVGTVSINKTDLFSIPIYIFSDDKQLEVEREYKRILTKYRMESDNSIYNLSFRMNDLIDYIERNIRKEKV